MSVSVKGGGIKADDRGGGRDSWKLVDGRAVRALNHAREREKAEIALFISLEKPTAAMTKDASSAGFYSWLDGKRKSPRIQLLTIEGLLSGHQRPEHPDYEPDLNFKKAKTEAHGEQPELL